MLFREGAREDKYRIVLCTGPTNQGLRDFPQVGRVLQRKTEA